MRDHDVSELTTGQLQRARRDLEVAMALCRPGSPVRVPVQARISAIDAEAAARATATRLCGCGLATDDDAMMDGHLFEEPDHEERDLSRYRVSRS
jgi:hypothetical protein